MAATRQIKGKMNAYALTSRAIGYLPPRRSESNSPRVAQKKNKKFRLTRNGAPQCRSDGCLISLCQGSLPSRVTGHARGRKGAQKSQATRSSVALPRDRSIVKSAALPGLTPHPMFRFVRPRELQNKPFSTRLVSCLAPDGRERHGGIYPFVPAQL